ncbi:MAG: cation:proton antiporter subunit C [Gammaproteobacteria bacterium]|nr:cation:proton antiporter subunit C [Gammaproteobacteria bacterium]MBU1654114.1 cation:proton antiporter subunit C [Gammaproteobacteria bacterium]MBU1961669.1 cation:proton antiporter subunit C [Gammaproteobacteria bacterium]
MAHIALATGFILILIGLYGALTNRNILRMIVSFTVADTGVNLVIVAVGYLRGRTAPILDATLPAAEAAARIIDPVPQALVLTAIVIGVGITALMLAYAYKLHETKGSLDIADYRELKW